MEFRIGTPPKNKQFNLNEDDEWDLIKMPNLNIIQLISVSVSILIVYLYLSMSSLFSVRDVLFNSISPPLLAIFFNPLLVLCIVPFHEVIHGIFHPKYGFSDCTSYGVLPKKGLVYAHYKGVIVRSRFIYILIGPLIFLSIIPILILEMLGLYVVMIARIAVWNFLLSSIDIFMTILVLGKIPNKSIIIDQDKGIYYK